MDTEEREEDPVQARAIQDTLVGPAGTQAPSPRKGLPIAARTRAGAAAEGCPGWR